MQSKYDRDSKGCQTDQGMLFEYIIAFLKALEDRVKTPLTSMDDSKGFTGESKLQGSPTRDEDT